MGELQSPVLYRETAERLKVQALAAGTPAMRDEFLRLAAMYEILASRALAQSALSARPPAGGKPE